MKFIPLFVLLFIINIRCVFSSESMLKPSPLDEDAASATFLTMERAHHPQIFQENVLDQHDNFLQNISVDTILHTLLLDPLCCSCEFLGIGGFFTALQSVQFQEHLHQKPHIATKKWILVNDENIDHMPFKANLVPHKTLIHYAVFYPQTFDKAGDPIWLALKKEYETIPVGINYTTDLDDLQAPLLFQSAVEAAARNSCFEKIFHTIDDVGVIASSNVMRTFAGLGHKIAAYNLAKYYELQTKDLARALYYYKSAYSYGFREGAIDYTRLKLATCELTHDALLKCAVMLKEALISGHENVWPYLFDIFYTHKNILVTVSPIDAWGELKQKSLEEIRRACAAEDPASCFKLAKYHFEMDRVPDISDEHALSLLTIAINAGYDDALRLKAKVQKTKTLRIRDRKDYMETLRALADKRQYVDDILIFANALLADKPCHETNFFHEKEQIARTYLKTAADMGDVNAAFQFASMCESGQGGDVSSNTAQHYYEKAYRHHHVEAAYRYAKLSLELDFGLDPAILVEALSFAAEKNHSDAAHLLARIQLQNAIENLRRADMLGHGAATQMLTKLSGIFN